MRYRLEYDSAYYGWQEYATYWFYWRARRVMGRMVTDGGKLNCWRIVEVPSGKLRMSVTRHRRHPTPADVARGVV